MISVLRGEGPGMSSTLWFSALQGNHLALCWFFPFSRVSYLITKEDSDLCLVPNFLTPFPGAGGGCHTFSNADWWRDKCRECGSGELRGASTGKLEAK